MILLTSLRYLALLALGIVALLLLLLVLLGTLLSGPLFLVGLLLTLAPYVVLGYAAVVTLRRNWPLRRCGLRLPLRVPRPRRGRGLYAATLGVVLLALPTQRLADKAFQYASCQAPRFRTDVPSPDGRYLASAITLFCGGAAGSIDGYIVLRHAWDQFELYPQNVASIEEGATGIDLSWQDDTTLVVDLGQRPHFEIPRRLDPGWQDVHVIYRGVDS
jgi:hypothetical protein